MARVSTKLAVVTAALCCAGCAPRAAALAPVMAASPEVLNAPTERPTLVTPPRPTATAGPTATPSPSATSSATPTATATATLAVTPDAEAHGRKLRLPVLMYHYVEPWPADASAVRQGLTVRPDDFEAQMEHLSRRGYVGVSLYDLIAALSTGAGLPERAVVITFDDGYRGLMEHALPPMQARGFAGTVFVITEPMDQGRPEYLTWDDARALQALGWRIESHTKTHASLRGASRDALIYELLGSLQTIEAEMGVRPRFVGYPYGHYDWQAAQVVQELDYWAAVTTVPGRGHTYGGRFDLRRVRVDGRGTLDDFILGLEGDLSP